MASVLVVSASLGRSAVGCGSGDSVRPETWGTAAEQDAKPRPEGDAGGPTPSDSGEPAVFIGASVVQHHNHASRDGVFVDSALSKAAAARLALDPTFAPQETTGDIDAQPLYVERGPGGRETLLVFTEANEAIALDAISGSVIWKRVLAPPAEDVPCFGVRPLGILGTPYVDLARRTIYLDSVHGTGTGTNAIAGHFVHAISLDDGTERGPAWPLEVAKVSTPGVPFNAAYQNQRGGLALVGGVVYVAYGAHAGDCGDYRGWVIGIPVDAPGSAKGFATGDARGCGIWGTPGVVSDGTSLFVATANGAGADAWGQSEAVLRLRPGPSFSGLSKDFFTPSNWREMDMTLKDLGASGPILVDVPGAIPSALVAAHGKAGVAHLLDRDNLGGVAKGDGVRGEGIDSDRLQDGAIVGAPATYRTKGATYVVFQGLGYAAKCPTADLANVVSYRVSATSPPKIQTAWCAYDLGSGSPSVTMRDATGSDAIVWVLGTENSNRLYGFDGETGETVFDGGSDESTQLPRVPRFAVPIAANGRIFVASARRPHAFRPK
ncbi:MAG: hypothetical protein JST00_28145 [Deltaproteobacteria bacterium]|nr:hypothetical protein [Deltaproteobacteria bacterium]